MHIRRYTGETIVSSMDHSEVARGYKETDSKSKAKETATRNVWLFEGDVGHCSVGHTPGVHYS